MPSTSLRHHICGRKHDRDDNSNVKMFSKRQRYQSLRNIQIEMDDCQTREDLQAEPLSVRYKIANFANKNIGQTSILIWIGERCDIWAMLVLVGMHRIYVRK